MNDSDMIRGLTSIKAIKQDIQEPYQRSELINKLRPYIEKLESPSGKFNRDIYVSELAKISAERSTIFQKINSQNAKYDYSDVDYATIVLKHIYLTSRLSGDDEVLTELENLIKAFVASADTLYPSEDEINSHINNSLKKFSSDEIKKIADKFTAIQTLFIHDRRKKSDFPKNLTKEQFNFALEVLFVGMVDFTCQENKSLNGMAGIFTILNFADKNKGSNFWGYSYEEAYDRVNMIMNAAKKYKELQGVMMAGVKILTERFDNSFKFQMLGLAEFFEFPENDHLVQFIRTLDFTS